MKKFYTLLVLLGLFFNIQSFAQVLTGPGNSNNTDVKTSPSLKYFSSLSENFSLWPPKDWTFIAVDGSNGFYNNGGYAFHTDDQVDCNDYMISPQITLSNEKYIVLKFDQYDKYPAYYDFHAVFLLDSPNPETANIIDTVYTGKGLEDAWETITIDLSAYRGQTFYLAFYYRGNYADRWGIDNVKIFSYNDTDIGITDIDPQNFVANGTIEYFNIYLTNPGLTDVNQNLTIGIELQSNGQTLFAKDSVYSINLAQGKDTTVTLNANFQNLNPGSYTLVATLTGDSIDNTYSRAFNVVLPQYTADYPLYGYSYLDKNQNFVKSFVNIDDSTGNIIALDTSLSYDSLFGATFAGFYGNDIMFVVNGNYLGVADPLQGTVYNIVRLGSAADSTIFSGLAYDITSGKLFTIGFNPQKGYFLYAIDSKTLKITQTGPIADSFQVVNITATPQGKLYGIDLANDRLVTIDPNTGNTYPAGQLGVTVDYYQDITYDAITQTLYAELFDYNFDTGDITAGIYTIDTLSGQAVLLSSNVCQITALAHKNYKPLPTNIKPADNLKLSPNPATNRITLQLLDKALIQIIDLTGKTVKALQTGPGTQTVDISSLNPGVYLIRVTYKNKTLSAKFIKN